MSEHYIKFENVKKSYGNGNAQINALDGVDFEINKGEFCILLGSSGAGKTTLLNMLGGMDTVTSGNIEFDGRKVSGFDKRELIEYRRHDVGFVFQFYNLIPNLTALENVEIAAQLCKNPIPAKEALDMVGLTERANNFPAQLSGGEQQRVAIARALAKKIGCAKVYDNAEKLERVRPDLIVDYAGFGVTTKAATKAVKTGGTVVLVGMGVSQFELDTMTIITNQVRLLGSVGSIPEDVAGVYEFFKKGLDPELTSIPFEDIEKGLEELKKGKIKGRLVAEINE